MTTSDYDSICDDLFDKRFTLGDNHCILPPLDCVFQVSDDAVVIEPLLTIRDKLLKTQEQLNFKDIGIWHEHTRFNHPASLIIRECRKQLAAELCTQAWSKMYEILSTVSHMLPAALEGDDDIASYPFRSFHLCEAPGAFVSALNHYLYASGRWKQLDWVWGASSLNPYYEGNNHSIMIGDDRLILNTLESWAFGPTNTGDIMDRRLLEELVGVYGKSSFHLITADGSVDCTSRPEMQERMTYALKYCEIVTAFHLLAEGGSLTVKLFTFFETRTVALLYLVCALFERVELFKPATSKGGNSEVYICARRFKGISEDWLKSLMTRFGETDDSNSATAIPIFPISSIPSSFIEKVTAASQLFVDAQIAMIQFNVTTSKHMEKSLRKYVEGRKTLVLEKFFSRYHTSDLPVTKRLSLSSCQPPWNGVGLWPSQEGTLIQRELTTAQERNAFLVQTLQQRMCFLREDMKELTKRKKRSTMQLSIDDEKLFDRLSFAVGDIRMGAHFDRIFNSKFIHAALLDGFCKLRAAFPREIAAVSIEQLELCRGNGIGATHLTSLRALTTACIDATAFTKLDWLALVKLLARKQVQGAKVLTVEEIERNCAAVFTITLKRPSIVLTRFSAAILLLFRALYTDVKLNLTADGRTVIELREPRRWSRTEEVAQFAVQAEIHTLACDSTTELVELLPMTAFVNEKLYRCLFDFNSALFISIVDRLLESIDQEDNHVTTESAKPVDETETATNESAKLNDDLIEKKIKRMAEVRSFINDSCSALKRRRSVSETEIENANISMERCETKAVSLLMLV